MLQNDCKLVCPWSGSLLVNGFFCFLARFGSIGSIVLLFCAVMVAILEENLKYWIKIEYADH